MSVSPLLPERVPFYHEVPTRIYLPVEIWEKIFDLAMLRLFVEVKRDWDADPQKDWYSLVGPMIRMLEGEDEDLFGLALRKHVFAAFCRFVRINLENKDKNNLFNILKISTHPVREFFLEYVIHSSGPSRLRSHLPREGMRGRQPLLLTMKELKSVPQERLHDWFFQVCREVFDKGGSRVDKLVNCMYLVRRSCIPGDYQRMLDMLHAKMSPNEVGKEAHSTLKCDK